MPHWCISRSNIRFKSKILPFENPIQSLPWLPSTSCIPEVCVEIPQFPLVEVHSLNHQAHHLLAVPWTSLVWAGGKENEGREDVQVWLHRKAPCYVKSVEVHVTSKPLGFSRSLRNSSMAFPSLMTRKESKVRVHTCVLFGATVKLDRGLQCIQGLSAPPGLPLHIHNVWLQLHHLLLQLTHPHLDTDMGNF